MGIIGRDVNSYKDVYVWDAYTGEKRLLYSAADQGGAFCGYNTYDEQGICSLLYGVGIQMSIFDNDR